MEPTEANYQSPTLEDTMLNIDYDPVGLISRTALQPLARRFFRKFWRPTAIYRMLLQERYTIMQIVWILVKSISSMDE